MRVFRSRLNQLKGLAGRIYRVVANMCVIEESLAYRGSKPLDLRMHGSRRNAMLYRICVTACHGASEGIFSLSNGTTTVSPVCIDALQDLAGCARRLRQRVHDRLLLLGGKVASAWSCSGVSEGDVRARACSAVNREKSASANPVSARKPRYLILRFTRRRILEWQSVVRATDQRRPLTRSTGSSPR
jgi:hypothetical protein